jgi:hypothetical protein
LVRSDAGHGMAAGFIYYIVTRLVCLCDDVRCSDYIFLLFLYGFCF